MLHISEDFFCGKMRRESDEWVADPHGITVRCK